MNIMCAVSTMEWIKKSRSQRNMPAMMMMISRWHLLYCRFWIHKHHIQKKWRREKSTTDVARFGMMWYAYVRTCEYILFGNKCRIMNWAAFCSSSIRFVPIFRESSQKTFFSPRCWSTCMQIGMGWMWECLFKNISIENLILRMNEMSFFGKQWKLQCGAE